MSLIEPLEAVIEEFSKFPGIGKKTAYRLAIYLLRRPPKDVTRFTEAVTALKQKVTFCKRCYNLAEGDYCSVCTGMKRDAGKICVVEDITDVMAIERTHEYDGLYHVLGGVLSPLSGIGPEDIRLYELFNRIRDEKTSEVILALNPDTEGDTTSMYIVRNLRESGLKISRIARGIPIGGDIEFSDDATISRALKGRITVSNE